MKKKYITIGLLATALTFGFVACKDDIDPLLEELDFNRILIPLDFTERVRSLSVIELDWTPRDGVETYAVEIHEDSLEFNNLIYEGEVTADQLPVQITGLSLSGETVYSARVMAVGSDGKEDSKWATVTATTPAENIYLPIQAEDVQDIYALLRWTAGSEVTHFVINPGNVTREITAGEKAAGQATIEDLTGSIAYTVTLYNGDKRRGVSTFTTTTPADVYPDDDLSVAIAEAEDGATLILAPGDYTVFTGTITLNKSITLVAQKILNRPVLHVAFSVAGGADDVSLTGIVLNGTGVSNTAFNLATAGAEYGSISLSNCEVYGYGNQLVYGNVAAKLGTLSVDNSVIHDFTTAGGDFIDFRTAYVGHVSLTNSTFYNAPGGRDFIRLDAAAAYTGTGLTSTVLIDHCTLYGVANTTDRILYVRFVANVLTVRNTIIAATNGIYSNQVATAQPTFANNNYFNAAGFYTASGSNKIDNSGTTLDPGFADAATADFTITNQTLIDNAVGDPRWRP